MGCRGTGATVCSHLDGVVFCTVLGQAERSKCLFDAGQRNITVPPT